MVHRPPLRTPKKQATGTVALSRGSSQRRKCTLLARPEPLSGHKLAGMASTRGPGLCGSEQRRPLLLWSAGQQLIPWRGGSSESIKLGSTSFVPNPPAFSRRRRTSMLLIRQVLKLVLSLSFCSLHLGVCLPASRMASRHGPLAEL